jgi:hypothetical protein
VPFKDFSLLEVELSYLTFVRQPDDSTAALAFDKWSIEEFVRSEIEPLPVQRPVTTESERHEIGISRLVANRETLSLIPYLQLAVYQPALELFK